MIIKLEIEDLYAKSISLTLQVLECVVILYGAYNS